MSDEREPTVADPDHFRVKVRRVDADDVQLRRRRLLRHRRKIGV